MALMLIIEPDIEADFLECSYGFRPDKSAHEAIDAIEQAALRGRLEVYDADLEKYFNSIPHDNLMKAVEKRVVDARVLKLIRMWLKAPIWEEGKSMSANSCGTQQGGVISPLLSNLYLHWFDKIFHSPKGPGQWAKATIVRYADDFVIMAKYLTPRIEEWIQQVIEDKFELKINKEKTKIIDMKAEKANVVFLGFNLKWIQGGKLQIQPAKKSIKKAKVQIREFTSPRMGCKPIKEVIGCVNRYLQGWGSYFIKGTPSAAYRELNWYANQRMIHFLRRRSQKGFKTDGQSWYTILKNLGLYSLTKESLAKNKRTFKRRFV
jgi:RNA-directed DNA polymerase